MNLRHRNAPLPTNVYLTSEKLIWTKDTTFVVSSGSMTCRPISRSTPVYEFIESISVCHCVFPTLKNIFYFYQSLLRRSTSMLFGFDRVHLSTSVHYSMQRGLVRHHGRRLGTAFWGRKISYGNFSNQISPNDLFRTKNF